MSTYYFLPTWNVLGEGAVQKAGELAKSLGTKKCLIVTSEYLGKVGMTDRVQEILKKAGVETSIFTKVEPSPTDKNVETGTVLYQENQCDSIIPLGGGSSHDCVKGIGLVTANGRKTADFKGVDKSSGPVVPLMTIDATAGTAPEITRFYITTDTSRRVKMTIVSWRVTSQIAINDLELMKGIPPALIVSTGMDAPTYVTETCVSTDANPLAGTAAIMPIKMITHYLSKAVANEDYMKARDKTAYAQYLTGITFNNVSLDYVHAITHQLSGSYNPPHGICNATLLPYAESYNLVDNMGRFRGMARAIGIQVEGISTTCAVEKATEAIKKLSRQLEIPSDLKQLGVREKDFGIMAGNAKKDVCQLADPGAITREQIIEIYCQVYVRK